MPALASRVGVDLGTGYGPVSVSPSIPPASGTSASNNSNTQPGLNVYLRCPIPPVWQSSPDSLRQFYQNNVVPQTRLFNPPAIQPISQQTVQQTVQNTTNVTNNPTTSLTATQNANLISSDGTSGSRQFFQTANPETTAPTSSFVFQNTTGVALLVSVAADGGGGGFHGVVYCDANPSPVTKVGRLSRVNAGSSNPNYYPGSATFIVPADYYYGISVTSGGDTPVGANALDSWTEWELGN